MSAELQIGIIGLDISHVVSFTELLNVSNHPYHVPGGRVVVAFPGGSYDFKLSYSRVDGFTKKLKEKFHVQIVHSPEAVAERCDAILLESVDGRVHLEQFRKIAPFEKPTFIGKPLTVSFKEAQAIEDLAQKFHLP